MCYEQGMKLELGVELNSQATCDRWVSNEEYYDQESVAGSMSESWDFLDGIDLDGEGISVKGTPKDKLTFTKKTPSARLPVPDITESSSMVNLTDEKADTVALVEPPPIERRQSITERYGSKFDFFRGMKRNYTFTQISILLNL